MLKPTSKVVCDCVPSKLPKKQKPADFKKQEKAVFKPLV